MLREASGVLSFQSCRGFSGLKGFLRTRVKDFRLLPCQNHQKLQQNPRPLLHAEAIGSFAKSSPGDVM
jgi:hypothetical protein